MTRWIGVAGVALLAACLPGGPPGADDEERGVRPGLSVLLSDSLELIRGKRVGLLADPRLADESGTPGLRLLRGEKATEATVTVRALAADRAPTPDALRDLDLVLIDLQGDGTRLGPETTTLVGALDAAARAGKPVVVLDRPNPLSGERTEGGVPDAEVARAADAGEDAPVPGLYPVPLRHGMTTGELARVLNERLALGASLKVVPMRGWRRQMWFDHTRLDWVPPSPDLREWPAAFVRAVVAPFDGSNVTVEREPEGATFRLGASWLDADRARALLEEREVRGVRVRESTVRAGGREVPALRVEVLDRDVQVPRISAHLLWALREAGGADSLRLAPGRAEVVFGSVPLVRELLAGGDPQEAGDRLLARGVTFRDSVRSLFLYYR